MASIIVTGESEVISELFLFANARSGGNKAQKYLDLKVDSLLSHIDGQQVRLQIFDMNNHESRLDGVRQISSTLNKCDRVRVMIAGGDGTLIWLVEDCLQHHLEVSRIEFGILPFGTGNDLAAAMNWGRSPPSPAIGVHLSGLHSSIKHWLKAEPERFDVWEVEITVEDDGYFEFIKIKEHGFERLHMIDETQHDVRVFKRLMTNYFSFGLDARIGVGFEKKRSKSRAKNKCIYLWEGVKKTCCLSVPRIPQLATQFKDRSQLIFDNTEAESALPDNASVFLALNIPTYGGGDNFVWKKTKKQFRKKSYPDSSSGDGRLEFLAFRGKFDLAMEQVVPGRAYRLHQGRGPFQLNFTPEPGEKRFYMQIDGEFFYAVRPRSVTISLSSLSDDLHLLRCQPASA